MILNYKHNKAILYHNKVQAIEIYINARVISKHNIAKDFYIITMLKIFLITTMQ